MLKKILDSAFAGGPSGWLVKYIATELFDEIGKPLIDFALNEADYVIDVQIGKSQIKRIDKAEKGNDAQEYDDAVDDIFK